MCVGGQGEVYRPQLFAGLGRALPELTQPRVAGQADPPLVPAPVTGCPSWPPPLAPLMGTWVSMSRLPALQGPGDTVTQKVFGKIKWSHLGTPPGESAELLPPRGRDQVVALEP